MLISKLFLRTQSTVYYYSTRTVQYTDPQENQNRFPYGKDIEWGYAEKLILVGVLHVLSWDNRVKLIVDDKFFIAP